MKLYRLKSNPTTIVEKQGDYAHIVWTDSMEKYGALSDSRWMIHKFNKDNSILLSGKESRNIKKKIKKFVAPIDSGLGSRISK
jgi:hypothetical protein